MRTAFSAREIRFAAKSRAFVAAKSRALFCPGLEALAAAFAVLRGNTTYDTCERASYTFYCTKRRTRNDAHFVQRYRNKRGRFQSLKARTFSVNEGRSDPFSFQTHPCSSHVVTSTSSSDVEACGPRVWAAWPLPRRVHPSWAAFLQHKETRLCCVLQKSVYEVQAGPALRELVKKTLSCLIIIVKINNV